MFFGCRELSTRKSCRQQTASSVEAQPIYRLQKNVVLIITIVVVVVVVVVVQCSVLLLVVMVMVNAVFISIASCILTTRVLTMIQTTLGYLFQLAQRGIRRRV